MPDPRLDAFVMANFRALCLLAAQRAGLPHETSPALAWTRSAPSPWPGFVLSAAFPDPDRDVPALLQQMKSGALPPRFLLTPDASPADLEDRLLRAGFELGVEWECMTCTVDDFQGHTSKPDAQAAECEMTTVRTDAEVSQWARIVLSFLYGKPEDSEEPLASIGGALLGDARVRLLVANYEGRPAASATLFMDEGIGGLYHVAVDPAFRRRGLGAALTTAAVETAFSKACRGMILHASKMGAPLYARLGFTRRFVVRGFRPKPE